MVLRLPSLCTAGFPRRSVSCSAGSIGFCGGPIAPSCRARRSARAPCQGRPWLQPRARSTARRMTIFVGNGRRRKSPTG